MSMHENTGKHAHSHMPIKAQRVKCLFPEGFLATEQELKGGALPHLLSPDFTNGYLTVQQIPQPPLIVKSPLRAAASLSHPH